MMRGFIALVLVVALLVGGLAHASVTHDHGHSHGADESSIWMTLHASLRHEEKSALFVISESFLLIVLVILIASTTAAHTHKLGQLTATLRDPYARDALRRGIYRYRVFG
ncbi:MAG: hypothetical protein Athens041674_380 [Parcubacteria group bacterium Athens0416_74]|nr:MAG: hypothetical protein Athens041674_380 [Parcubacteria group bacterium Athens0416_74]